MERRPAAGSFRRCRSGRCSDGRRIWSGQPPAQHKSIAGGCLFPGARCHSAGPGALVTRRRCEPIQRKWLTPGGGGYRRGSCGAGGKVRYERKMPEQDHTWQQRASAVGKRRSCDGKHHRDVQNQAFCCTGRPRRTVRCRKWPCGVREARLSIGGCARRWQQEQVRRTGRHMAGGG